MLFELSVAGISIMIAYFYNTNDNDGEQIEVGRRY